MLWCHYVCDNAANYNKFLSSDIVCNYISIIILGRVNSCLCLTLKLLQISFLTYVIHSHKDQKYLFLSLWFIGTHIILDSHFTNFISIVLLLNICNEVLENFDVCTVPICTVKFCVMRQLVWAQLQVTMALVHKFHVMNKDYSLHLWT